MSDKAEGRADCHQPAPETNRYTGKPIDLPGQMKTAVITLALWGLFPIAIADLIVKLGGRLDV